MRLRLKSLYSSILLTTKYISITILLSDFVQVDDKNASFLLPYFETSNYLSHITFASSVGVYGTGTSVVDHPCSNTIILHHHTGRAIFIK